MGLLLEDLVRRFGGRLEPNAPAIVVEDIELDSRRVRPGGLFTALPGAKDDGARHVAEAFARGAVALLVPSPLRCEQQGAVQWIHAEARGALARAALALHGEPARTMALAAITGTNGKTTTAHMLGQLLERAGAAPAVFGTAGHRLAGGLRLAAAHTTPDAPDLARLLRRHAARGGRTVAMEVSSHALEQERTTGLAFDVAVFTNLTREHLDYHGDMQRYAAAKARLFAGLRPGAAAVLNLDDDSWRTMAAAADAAGARIITYSTRQAADVRASRLRADPAGTRFELDGMGIFSTDVRLPLRGRYNVENALAAVAAARLMGASPSAIVEGLATTSAAPGRFEPILTGARGFQLFVDYAHTPDALERVLREGRTLVAEQGRLIAVFGCGGDRDRGKRAPMGQAAGALADVVVLTSDNPRSEDPRAIAEHVLAGLIDAPAEVVLELERRAAIAHALSLARAGDVVVIAGKGHETTQEIGGERFAFDDRVVALEELARQEVAA